MFYYFIMLWNFFNRYRRKCQKVDASFFRLVARTRRKKEKKIVCLLLDGFACGQVLSPRLYRLTFNFRDYIHQIVNLWLKNQQRLTWCQNGADQSFLSAHLIQAVYIDSDLIDIFVNQIFKKINNFKVCPTNQRKK